MPEKTDLERKRDGLLFSVRRSVRYHARRRRHFDFLHRLTLFISLLFSSATFAALLGRLGGEDSIYYFAGIVTLATALDLVFGSAMRARDHHDFERRWIGLERKIIGAGEYDGNALAEFTGQRLEIEEEEEPPLRVLDIMCHNELARAMGRDHDIYEIGFLQKLLSQWIDLGVDSIQRSKPRPVKHGAPS